RHLVVLIFIRRVAPFELFGREPIAFAQQTDPCLDRLEIDPRRNVDLANAAEYPRVLLERGLEPNSTEMCARQPNDVHAGRELVADQPGRADQLEGASRAPAF